METNSSNTRFANQFGLDPTAILTSKSEVKKRSYTDEGVKFTEANQDILNNILMLVITYILIIH